MGDARNIAVTNHADGPLAQIVDAALCPTAQNNLLFAENSTARIAQRNLLGAHVVAVAHRDRAAADQNHARTLRVVLAKRKL